MVMLLPSNENKREWPELKVYAWQGLPHLDLFEHIQNLEKA